MASENNDSSVGRSPTDSEFWSTPNGQATLALVQGLSSPYAVLQVQARDSVEEEQEEEEEGDIQEYLKATPTVANRNLLLLDEVQQKEIVQKGVKTVEDQLFEEVETNPNYGVMDLLNASANNPRISLLATSPESHYWNNESNTEDLMKSLKKTIAQNEYDVKRNAASAAQAQVDLGAAIRDRDAKKAAYDAACSFVETIEARQAGYMDAAETTKELKRKHEVDLKVVTLLNGAIVHVKSLYADPSLYDQLPYGRTATMADRDALGREIFKLDPNSLPRSQRKHMLIARPLKLYGFELSPAGHAYGSALKVGKSTKSSEYTVQTRGVFGWPAAAASSGKRLLPSSGLVATPQKKKPAIISQKSMTALQTFFSSPQGKEIQHVALAVCAAANTSEDRQPPAEDDRKPPAKQDECAFV